MSRVTKVVEVNSCTNCANNGKRSCLFYRHKNRIEKRKEVIGTYDFDCFQSYLDKMMCDMMCGEPEDY